MKVTLIIDGKTADLSEDGLILMTYQATDAEQPAAVKNSYSQSVTLPSTPTNDAIFAHLLRSDFKTTTGRFDVLARTPFEIRNERQEILVSGYLKLNSGVPGTSYDISLFGGLGGFFYSLKYNSDGTEKTLASLSWKHGSYWYASGNSAWTNYADLHLDAESLADRYNGSLDTDAPVVFAPFNEGIPKDFDANKAWYKAPSSGYAYNEIQATKIVDGVQYGTKNTDGGILLELSDDHDSWETQEFRNTLQRPLWSVKAFLEAVAYSANNGGYSVEIDSEFTASNFVQRGYVTLKCDFADSLASDGSLSSLEPLLSDTKSPCDYLLSIAKVCGLMFVYDEQAKKVQILTRNTFYEKYYTSRINLAGLIAENKGKTITPLLMSDKWQVLSAENYGGRAEGYNDRKGRQYGSLWVNTGYEFGGNENDVLSSSVLKGAADVLESNANYRVLLNAKDSTSVWHYYWKLTATDPDIKYKLYATVSGSLKSVDCTPDYGNGSTTPPTENFKYYNSSQFGGVTELPQLRDADRNQEDGNDVLVFYQGEFALPTGTQSSATWRADFYATEATEDMLDLNNGTPCWNISTDSAAKVTQFPLFQRQYVGEGGVENWSLLFARPSEFFTSDTSYTGAIAATDYLGARCWNTWLTERCHADVRRMKCWVNLRTAATPKVDADLLRRFWYYEGAIWVLDKITSHSLTTDDLTECEFIKVRDITAYYDGQSWD